MITVLLDTNVILDVLAARQPFVQEAEKIFALAAAERIAGYLTANSVTDLYYLLRKHLTAQAAKEALARLFSLFSVLDVRAADCLAALDKPGDFEDALLLACAQRRGRIDYIVTRDQGLQEFPSPIPVVSPAVLLKRLKVT
jgi:predicted nucleic acid-binding protein